MYAVVDPDWVCNTSHWKSELGLVLFLCDNTILHKIKYQDCTITSFTEVEFTAACNTGNAILYVCSIVDMRGIPQDEDTATPLSLMIVRHL